MLVLAFVLTSSIVILLVREGRSETYRCPYCAQIQVGSYHRFRCLLVNGQENNILLPSEAWPVGDHLVASREAFAMKELGRGRARTDYKKGILALLPGLLGQRGAVENATADLSHHVQVASPPC
jgi:hypothetical protein